MLKVKEMKKIENAYMVEVIDMMNGEITGSEATFFERKGDAIKFFVASITPNHVVEIQISEVFGENLYINKNSIFVKEDGEFSRACDEDYDYTELIKVTCDGKEVLWGMTEDEDLEKLIPAKFLHNKKYTIRKTEDGYQVLNDGTLIGEFQGNEDEDAEALAAKADEILITEGWEIEKNLADVMYNYQ